MTFKKFFEHYGDALFIGYQGAKADGNEESFTDWVLGEYGYYLWLKSDEPVEEGFEKEDEYEVPYTE